MPRPRKDAITHITTQVTAAVPTSTNRYMQVLTRAKDIVGRLPGAIDTAKNIMAPAMTGPIETLFDRYESAVDRLANTVNAATGKARLPTLHRVSRVQADVKLEQQLTAITALTERVIRHVAYRVQQQGFSIFKLKSTEKKRKAAGAVKASVDVIEADVQEHIQTKSKAESLPIETVQNLLSQVLEAHPDQYYSAWSALEITVNDWWTKLLCGFATELDGIRLFLDSAVDEPRIISASTCTLDAFKDLREQVLAGKINKLTEIHVPAALRSRVRPLDAVAFVVKGATLEPPVQYLREKIGAIHQGSVKNVTAARIADALMDGFGRWAFDLEHGVMRPVITASIPLARAARGTYETTRLLKRPDASGTSTYTFRAARGASASSSTFLDVRLTLDKGTLNEAAERYLQDVALDEIVDAGPAEMLAGVFAPLRGYLSTISGGHNVNVVVEGRDDPSRVLVFVTTSMEIPINKIGTSSTKLMGSTRAILQAVLGTPEANLVTAQRAASIHGNLLQPIDAYPLTSDGEHSVSYAVRVVFEADAEGFARPVSEAAVDKAYNTVVHYLRLLGASEGAVVTQSDELLIANFLLTHHAARKKREREIPKRTFAEHPDYPGRAFDAVMLHGSLRVRLPEGIETVSTDGWLECENAKS